MWTAIIEGIFAFLGSIFGRKQEIETLTKADVNEAKMNSTNEAAEREDTINKEVDEKDIPTCDDGKGGITFSSLRKDYK